MAKKRHTWERQISQTGEYTECIKCGIIKYCFGWIGGYRYYYPSDDFYFYKTPSCGQGTITKQMLIDAKIQFFKMDEMMLIDKKKVLENKKKTKKK